MQVIVELVKIGVDTCYICGYDCGMASIDDLITILCQRQADAKQSDYAFAQRLGCSRQMWQFIRTGQRLPGAETLQRIGQAYPDLMGLCVAVVTAPLFLPSNATNVTLTATPETTEVTA